MTVPRLTHFFSPHEGRVAAITDANITAAKNGTLKVSMPWLSFNADKEQGNHSATGSNAYLPLFDRLYETNSSNDAELLRHLNCIKELEGKVNKEVVEQLHASFNKNQHFMNQMTLLNHRFLFKSIIDLKNVDKNKSILKRQEECRFFVNFDSVGKAVFGHEHCNDENKYTVQQAGQRSLH